MTISIFESAPSSPEPAGRLTAALGSMSSTSDSDDELTTDLSSWKPINSHNAPARSSRTRGDDRDGKKATRAGSATAPAKTAVRVEILAPGGFDRNQYEDLTALAEVVAEVVAQTGKVYQVLFEDGHMDEVSLAQPLMNSL